MDSEAGVGLAVPPLCHAFIDRHGYLRHQAGNVPLWFHLAFYSSSISFGSSQRTSSQ